MNWNLELPIRSILYLTLSWIDGEKPWQGTGKLANFQTFNASEHKNETWEIDSLALENIRQVRLVCIPCDPKHSATASSPESTRHKMTFVSLWIWVTRWDKERECSRELNAPISLKISASSSSVNSVLGIMFYAYIPISLCNLCYSLSMMVSS